MDKVRGTCIIGCAHLDRLHNENPRNDKKYRVSWCKDEDLDRCRDYFYDILTEETVDLPANMFVSHVADAK